jgi:hypothetical protein
MKLNAAQVVRAVSQLEVEALPENHPLTPKLNQVFGDHTYFLDGNLPRWQRPQYRGTGCRRDGRARESRKLDGLQAAQARSA